MLSDPEVLGNRKLFRQTAKEHKDLTPVVETWKQVKALRQEIEESKELANDSDPEIAEMAREEIPELEARQAELDETLKLLLLPKDPLDGRNVYLEIRAGTGGDEAALFASDLFRMYSRVAERLGWRVDITSTSQSDVGGYKEIIANVSGDDVWSQMKYESGVHRVQRVPQTESQGRIHTSTCTVAILPEADEVDVQIADKDLRIDVFRASGPGGQSVNTTDSAVRITHIPTGLVVSQQDEKSQHKNKAKALKVLRARLLEAEIAKVNAERSATRKAQVGSGGRSERIRTYNYPENRVSDHRIGLTVHKLDKIIEGDLVGNIIEPLREHYQAEMLKGGS